MNNARPDYFKPTTPIESMLRRVKGNYRRQMLLATLERDGLDTFSDPWFEHELPSKYKNLLSIQNPGFRGGEGLPDLLDGEVEIARHSLVDSVHGEVISLRALSDEDGRSIQLRMVDEYGDIAEEEYKLEKSCFSSSLTAEEVLQVFNNSEPCACLQSCEQRFSSDFYPGLDELADRLNIKQVWED